MRKPILIKEALKLIDQGMSRYAAAKAVGLATNAVYVADGKRKAKENGVCYCCGQPLPKKV